MFVLAMDDHRNPVVLDQLMQSMNLCNMAYASKLENLRPWNHILASSSNLDEE